MLDFTHLPKFTISESKSEEYAEWVSQTAKLLNRKFISMHAIFTKEKWSLGEIKTAYFNATKHHGTVTPQIAWWANRKRRTTDSSHKSHPPQQ